MRIESKVITAGIDSAIESIRAQRNCAVPSSDARDVLWDLTGVLAFLGGYVGEEALDVRRKLAELVDLVRGGA